VAPVPRQRTARIPLLRSPATRVDGPRQRGGSPIRARLIALGLVLVSLALLTVYLRESTGGPLHGAQRIVVSALTPFEAAAERVSRPFRDAYGWTADLFTAKDENAELREEVRELRRQVIVNQTAAQENEELRRLLEYRDGPRFPDDYRAVATRVIIPPQNEFRQEAVVAAGSGDGVAVEDPVVTDEGLVGTVTEVTSSSARVRLLTDQQSAASAFVPQTDAAGIVERGPSTASLAFELVPKEEAVEEGHIVVTAGSRAGRLESLFPRGIPICVVASVSQRDTDFYKRIQCVPLVDFDSLAELIVLTRKGPQ
jgi:rod shape-determining protein MreC